jgi:hypothetical protein
MFRFHNVAGDMYMFPALSPPYTIPIIMLPMNTGPPLSPDAASGRVALAFLLYT